MDVVHPSSSDPPSESSGEENVTGPDRLLLWMFVAGFGLLGLIILADLLGWLIR
jgi:hypothetical protein